MDPPRASASPPRVGRVRGGLVRRGDHARVTAVRAGGGAVLGAYGATSSARARRGAAPGLRASRRRPPPIALRRSGTSDVDDTVRDGSHVRGLLVDLARAGSLW